MKKFFYIFLLVCILTPLSAQNKLVLNDKEYFESPSTSILVFNDSYAEGHQGGIQIIQHGQRIAANGDIRLEPTPGQWQPFSQLNAKSPDPLSQTITVSLSFPNEQAATRTFNRIDYPDLDLDYEIVLKPEGESIRLIINLNKPLPKEWVGKVGFNLELFPGSYFGKKYLMDSHPGSFPLQLDGPFTAETGPNKFEVSPLAEGNRLTIAPEDALCRLNIESTTTSLQLIDGRAHHNNGWFIVRSLIPKGIKEKAIEWLISPSVVEGWEYGPAIHINQAGYLPNQMKEAILECDPRQTAKPLIQLIRLTEEGKEIIVRSDSAAYWGKFQRYQYYSYNFSDVNEEGIYYLKTLNTSSEPFQIAASSYDRGVWQPTLEYFLPVQMCHMRINDRYRIWHGLCHMDDARMAPTDYVHFDGYQQGESTLCPFEPMDHVPNLNIGGWHDAGDYDLRVESQSGTVYALSLIYEAFKPEYDMTTIDQGKHLVEMHVPDGKPDILQQIEHGTLTVVHGYNELGRLYRGIICNDLRQYVMLGDGSVMTDNINFGDTIGVPDWFGRINDDRWVFTEVNPWREMMVSANLAAASRTLKGFNDSLSTRALEIAEILYQLNADKVNGSGKVIALTELILTTGKSIYVDQLLGMSDYVAQHTPEIAWAVARIFDQIRDNRFQRGYMLGIQTYYRELQEETGKNPFGVPYHPRIWGSAWGIEKFGVEQYYLFTYLKIEDARKYLLHSLDYVLGVHPGENTASFVSGVGTRSATVAYGLNRADWSYIPGGVISGTANIQPDFPELKTWPFLWQQTEYVLGGAASNFMFLVLGSKDILE